MKTAKVIYNGGLRCKLTHNKSSQRFITDAPTDNQGKGEAFSPTDLLATSLAACMFTIMGIYAQQKGISIEGSEADVVKKMSSDAPRRVIAIEIDFRVKLDKDSENTRTALIRSAGTCPVALSLSHKIEQIVNFTFV